MTTTTAPRALPWPLVLAMAAVTPYLALKLLWLTGSPIGLTEAATETMRSTRFVVGNLVTVGLELVALGLAWSLTRPWADRLPARLFALLAAGASGLLAPILLGMPLGQVVETIAHGRPSVEGEGMAAWVFGCVYGGFTLLGVALAVLLCRYADGRWGASFASPPRVQRRLTFALGAVTVLPFALAMGWWGVVGPGDAGPQGMEAPVQRTVLVVSGLLALAAVVAPSARLAVPPQRGRLPHLVVWVGCCTAALQGPTQLLLAHGGTIQPAVAAITLLATPGALAVLAGVHGDLRSVGAR